MIDYLNNLLSFLDKIQGLSAVALVCAFCIASGYGLKAWKKFPNELIPFFIILVVGPGFMLGLADPRATTMPPRIWFFRNVAVGVIIGFIAWQLHYWVLYYIEDKLKSLFGSKDKPTETQPEQPQNERKDDTKS